MENNWTQVWPKVEGWFWFYGDPFAYGKASRDKEILLVKVRTSGNGYPVYIVGGYMIYKNEAGKDCYWMPAILPEPPVEELK